MGTDNLNQSQVISKTLGDNIRKVMTITKNRPWILFITVILVGFLLRVTGINKPDGFSLDESYCFDEARQSFPFGILEKLSSSGCSCPLIILFFIFG